MRRIVTLATACGLMALASCGGSKTVRRTVIIDGKPIAEERVRRDPSQPFAYDGWALQLKGHIDTKLASGGLGAGAQKTALRDVSERIMMLVNMRTQLAKDWNAFAVSEADYARRSEFIDKSFLALQVLTGHNTSPDVNQAVLDQLAEWSRDVNQGLMK